MESEATKRAYELAYHITPDMEESAVPARVQELEAIVAQNGGAVSASREAKKIHLSYPLEHKHYAYFGVVDFQADTDSIESLNAQLKLQEGILRFMIVKKPDLKEVRTLGDHRARAARRVAPTHKAAAPTEVKPKQEEKKIEAELEDVLGKI